jgi:hypothetical protein
MNSFVEGRQGDVACARPFGFWSDIKKSFPTFIPLVLIVFVPLRNGGNPGRKNLGTVVEWLAGFVRRLVQQ